MFVFWPIWSERHVGYCNELFFTRHLELSCRMISRIDGARTNRCVALVE